MMEIEVGDYVRTEEGVIAKVISKDGLFIDIDKEYFDECYRSMRKVTFQERITKHSKNIIDLIEVGDYVNGFEVDEFEDCEGIMHIGFPIYDDSLMDCIIEYRPLDTVGIKSIVTHEQFKNIEYRIDINEEGG